MKVERIVNQVSRVKGGEVSSKDIIASSFATPQYVPTRPSKRVYHAGHVAGWAKVVSREVAGDGHLIIKLDNGAKVGIHVLEEGKKPETTTTTTTAKPSRRGAVSKTA